MLQILPASLLEAAWWASKTKGVNWGCCSRKTSALGKVFLYNRMNGFVKLIGKQKIQICNSSVSVLTCLVFISSPFYQLNCRDNNMSRSVTLTSSLFHCFVEACVCGWNQMMTTAVKYYQSSDPLSVLSGKEEKINILTFQGTWNTVWCEPFHWNCRWLDIKYAYWMQ